MRVTHFWPWILWSLTPDDRLLTSNKNDYAYYVTLRYKHLSQDPSFQMEKETIVKQQIFKTQKYRLHFWNIPHLIWWDSVAMFILILL